MTDGFHYEGTVEVTAYRRQDNGIFEEKGTVVASERGPVDLNIRKMRWPPQVDISVAVIDVFEYHYVRDWEGYYARRLRVRLMQLQQREQGAKFDLGVFPEYCFAGFIAALFHGERSEGNWMPAEQEQWRDLLCTVRVYDVRPVPNVEGDDVDEMET